MNLSAAESAHRGQTEKTEKGIEDDIESKTRDIWRRYADIARYRR